MTVINIGKSNSVVSASESSMPRHAEPTQVFSRAEGTCDAGPARHSNLLTELSSLATVITGSAVNTPESLQGKIVVLIL